MYAPLLLDIPRCIRQLHNGGCTKAWASNLRKKVIAACAARVEGLAVAGAVVQSAILTCHKRGTSGQRFVAPTACEAPVVIPANNCTRKVWLQVAGTYVKTIGCERILAESLNCRHT